MPPNPESNVDAYRTLGLEPGASKAEIKRAYRLLAKAFHPDSAGEAALPRFLAIHEAYDRLTTGRIGAPLKAARSAPAEPWRADPARARQARERARTARGTTGAAGGSRPGASGSTGGASGAGGSTSGAAGSNAGARGTGASGRSTSGTSGTTGASRGGSGTRGGGRRHVRKATMGSTSYDEARDVNDPTWSGASWYGPSSGEYWIVNPREYADPRKHGPEYQSRARRPLPGDAVAPSSASTAGTSTGAAAPADLRDEPNAKAEGWTAAAPPSEAAERPPRWGSRPSASSWSAPAERGTAAGRAGERARGFDETKPTASARHPAAEAGTGAQTWLGGPADDPIRRLGFALVAWPPIGLAAAAVIAAATGCGPASTACGGGVEPLLPLLAQAAILGVLLLFAPLTRVLAGGAFGLLVAVVPFSMLFLAIGGTATPRNGPIVGVLLGAAWLGGVAWATVRTRAGRSPGAPT